MATTDTVRLLDADVLLALNDAGHLHHASARRWFQGVPDWATSPVTEAAYLRLAANPLVMRDRVTAGEALAELRRIRQAPGHQFLIDDSTLDAAVIELTGMVGYRQVTDFHLVNLAARHGAVLATFDVRLVRVLAPADRVHVELVPV